MVERLAQMVGYGLSGLLVPVVGAQGIYLSSAGVVATSAGVCLRAVRRVPAESGLRLPTAPEPGS